MSSLSNILASKNFEESKAFFKENNINVSVHGNIYVVYPSTEANTKNQFIKECNRVFIDVETNKILHYFTQVDEVYSELKDVIDYARNCTISKIMLRFEGTLIKLTTTRTSGRSELLNCPMLL